MFIFFFFDITLGMNHTSKYWLNKYRFVWNNKFFFFSVQKQWKLVESWILLLRSDLKWINDIELAILNTELKLFHAYTDFNEIDNFSKPNLTSSLHQYIKCRGVSCCCFCFIYNWTYDSSRLTVVHNKNMRLIIIIIIFFSVQKPDLVNKYLCAFADAHANQHVMDLNPIKKNALLDCISPQTLDKYIFLRFGRENAIRESSTLKLVDNILVYQVHTHNSYKYRVW